MREFQDMQESREFISVDLWEGEVITARDIVHSLRPGEWKDEDTYRGFRNGY